MKNQRKNRRKLYAAFLKTDFWLKLSAQQKLLYPQCSKCGSTSDLQSHHHRYPENWFETTLEDLITLCKKCHRKEHGLYVTPQWVEVKRRIQSAIFHEQRPAKEDWKFLKNDAESELMWDEFGIMVMFYAAIILKKERRFCRAVHNSILSRDIRWEHLANDSDWKAGIDRNQEALRANQ